MPVYEYKLPDASRYRAMMPETLAKALRSNDAKDTIIDIGICGEYTALHRRTR